MKKAVLTLLAITGLIILGGCHLLPGSSPLDEVARSHVEGNAPPVGFDKIMKRDLTAYFQKSKGKGVTIDHQYLRIGATQSGVSYPKYYLWVNVYRNKKLVDAGAVRVAGVEQTHFEVTNFLSKSQIKKYPQQIDSVFPQPVCERIRQKVK